MNLTLEALRILDIIDRKGSFAAAALALDRVPSALTYTVRKLEEDLDLLLFDRGGHRAKLTIAGTELLTEGRHLLRAAEELEQRVKRTATGREVELRIVLDSIIPFERMVPLIEAFDRAQSGTRLRLSFETLSGVWEALSDGRADLAIGAAYEGPESIRMNTGFQIRPIGQLDWVFAVAPEHPLALHDGPLSAERIRQHRAVAVGDTGRHLSGPSSGLLMGQETLTVPSIAAKLAAQVAGLGCGYLPRVLAAQSIANGQLIAKETADAKIGGTVHYAWRRDARGKSLKWFLAQLADPAVQTALVGN